MATDEQLDRAYAAIVAEARAQIAAGREPNAEALRARVRAATERAGADVALQRRALRQLERVLAVHRARTIVAREPGSTVPPPATVAPPRPQRRSLLRTRPTITGNMDVRAEAKDGVLTLRSRRSDGRRRRHR